MNKNTDHRLPQTLPPSDKWITEIRQQWTPIPFEDHITISQDLLQEYQVNTTELSYFLTALKASCKSYKASKNSHKTKKDNNRLINDDNTNIATTVYDINNLEIVANHQVNATTNVENADAEENTENDEVGENSTEEVPSPLIYGRKTNDPTKVKSSKRRRPVKVTPLESPMGNPQNDKDKDQDATDTPNTYVFDPNDVQIHSSFLEGEPEGKELEGIEEEKLLEIHRAFQQKLKERCRMREKYNKKDTRI